MDKRDFLRTVGGAAAGAAFADLGRAGHRGMAATGDFWEQLRARYRLPADRIDLEHGFYSRAADEVLDAFVAHARAVNVDAAFYMRTRQADDKLQSRTLLAELAGCGADELIVTRNTTESLDTVIAGFDWRQGDEAVMAHQDYRAMLLMFEQQARRFHIVNRLVSLPVDPASDDEIVELYASAITGKTRLLMIPHLVNITGQILPVRRIVDMAHAKGVPVLVDGAHAFAHFAFTIPELGCDYYGASLHKWLGCPLGAGILYVKQERVAGLWPLFGDDHADTVIDKLNHTGTHPVATDLAIQDAIALHREIGIARKEERLRWLQRYWTDKVRSLPRVRLFTPKAPERSCAIATFSIDGIEPDALAKELLARYRIFAVAIERAAAGVRGVRVTPQLYTTTAELDALVTAIGELAKA
ncbi:MAG: aminotransferase class V-fold PLP-dependent enzyme [Planctomycetota bacterium]